MGTPYIGEIRIFGFSFAPIDWAFCDGQQMPIDQYAALFAIVGTTYGGNGQTTFALPNLQDRAVMHQGQGPGLTNRVLGQSFGSVSVTLLQTQLPAHSHPFVAAQTPSDKTKLVGTPSATALLSSSNPGKLYSATTTPTVNFSPKAIGQTGGSQPHNNVQPLETLNFCIALNGIFPSQN
jgi:microcystin-dependent protein